MIGCLSPWYGSKRTLAPRIVETLGQHRVYWEPFCGSMAVLLAKPRATMETVSDLHGDLVNLAHVIQDPKCGPQLYRRLRRTLFCQAFLEDAKKVIEDSPFEPTIDRAYHFFVYSWFGRNGTIGSKSGVNFCVRYTSGGGQPATRWESAVASLSAWRERLRGVTILNVCGLELCERVEDAEGTALYADPPYLIKGSKYIHDFDEKGHERLARALGRLRRTRVVVSYYDHPSLATLYPGWTKIPLEVTKAMVSMGQRGRGKAVAAPEVLLVNGKNYSDEPTLF